MPTPPVTPDPTAARGPIGDIPSVTINGVMSALDTSKTSISPSSSVELGSAVDVVSAPLNSLPFELASGPTPITSQSVSDT